MKKIHIAVAASLCAAALILPYLIFAEPISEDIYYPVSRVIDGDTIELQIRNRSKTIRLLGINSPESVDPRREPECFGVEASKYTKKLLAGRLVRIDFEENREARDKYGRYLAYVYRDDGLFVNEQLLRSGYAREYTYGNPYSLQISFRQAEHEAKVQKRGLWNECLPINN